MPDITPKRNHKAATRALYVLVPATGASLVAYLSGWFTEQHGRVLYQGLLLLTCTCIVVAAVSAGQLAIANAFRAGYLTGLELGKAEQAAADEARERRLRLVHDATGTGGNPPVGT
jgi:MFS family permease